MFDQSKSASKGGQSKSAELNVKLQIPYCQIVRSFIYLTIACFDTSVEVDIVAVVAPTVFIRPLIYLPSVLP